MLHYEDVILYFENSLGYLIHDNMSSLAYKIVEFSNTYGYFNYSDFIDYIRDDTVLNETNFAYTRDNNNDPAGGTGGTGGSDKDGIRDRVNWHYGCATGLAGFSGAKGEASVKKLDSICPKVESWQFIYN